MISFSNKLKCFLSSQKYSLIFQSFQKIGDSHVILPYAYNEYPLLFDQITPHTCELTFNNLEQLNAANFRTTVMLQNIIKDEFTPNDSEIKLIIMKGAGNKAFCSGGDLKLFYYAKHESYRVKNYKCVLEMFNYHDYETINQIKNIKQITMSIYNGITMGAGVGYSIYCPFRIATEKSRLAMPEIKLGFFCDCAASYFLPQFAHNIGYFLALTAKSIVGYDLVEAGAATHFISTMNLDKFQEELYKNVKEDCTIDKVQKIVDKFSEKRQSSDPLSLRTTFELFQKAKNLSLSECLKIDTRLASRLMYHQEFEEGIQGVFLKRKYKPKWMYQSPLDIPKSCIEELFKPLEQTKELKI